MGVPANLSPDRPAAVPAEGRWEPRDGWLVGELDERHERHGAYRMWTRDGVLHAECTFDHGSLHGMHTTYHPDGTIASQADWVRGEMQNSVFFRSAAPTPEPFPAAPSVWSVRYYARGSNTTVRYFLRDGTECSSDGRPCNTGRNTSDL